MTHKERMTRKISQLDQDQQYALIVGLNCSYYSSRPQIEINTANLKNFTIDDIDAALGYLQTHMRKFTPEFKKDARSLLRVFNPRQTIK